VSLAARNLDFGYPGKTVGRHLDLDLGNGEVMCVLGPNGAGKTTLFRTLLGLLAPIAGKVSVGGRELAELSRAEVARALAYVPQASTSHFDFSLAEVVEMGRTAHLSTFARPGKRDREISLAALERMGIASLAARPVNAVSGGERQLALIARALATEARAVIMDEPTANLDFANQARVLHEIERMRAEGIAVLLCTHDPDHALQVADRALLLSGGQALAQGDAAAVLDTPNLSRLYGVKVAVAEIAISGGTRRVCVPEDGRSGAIAR
jgi:iron complex transport system ATP-binding protein